MEKFNNLKAFLLSLEADTQKFYDKENKAAGVRVRKGLQEMKALVQELRVEITEKKNKIK